MLDGEFAMVGMMAEAIANGVVDEITQNAIVVVDAGSSSGTYK